MKLTLIFLILLLSGVMSCGKNSKYQKNQAITTDYKITSVKMSYIQFLGRWQGLCTHEPTDPKVDRTFSTIKKIEIRDNRLCDGIEVLGLESYENAGFYNCFDNKKQFYKDEFLDVRTVSAIDNDRVSYEFQSDEYQETHSLFVSYEGSIAIENRDFLVSKLLNYRETRSDKWGFEHVKWEGNIKCTFKRLYDK